MRTPLYVCIVRRTGVTGRFSQQRCKECILFPQDTIIMFFPQWEKDGKCRKRPVLSPALLIFTAILLTCLYLFIPSSSAFAKFCAENSTVFLGFFLSSLHLGDSVL